MPFQKGHPNYFKHHTEEWKKRMSLLKMGKKLPPLTEEHKRKISNALKGKPKPPRTIEHIKKLALANIGNKQSKETIEKRVSHFRGENHYAWKGENVSYDTLHHWISKKLGKPQKCEMCGRDGLTGRQIHWANIGHFYKRNIIDWIRLCANCHKKYDKAII